MGSSRDVTITDLTSGERARQRTRDIARVEQLYADGTMSRERAERVLRGYGVLHPDSRLPPKAEEG